MTANDLPAAIDPDRDALERLVWQDDAALAELYDRHGRTAYALAYRVLLDREAAEEAVQEAFLAVWRRAATYQPERGSVRTWLLTVVRNRAIDALRAREARPRTTAVDDLPLAAPDDPEQAALRRVDGSRVRRAVATLPADQRTAVELAYFAGLSYPEIATRTGVPLGTVKSRLRLALGRLRSLLDAEGGTCPAPV
jgi:RNA polymerase sigma-70 factor (ECF subfamily)